MKDPSIKKRKFAVSGLKDQGNINKLKKYLGSKAGMIAVDADSKKRFLRVEYNLKKMTFKQIEKHVKELGFALSQKITEKLKRGMAKFTEQNELDNLSAASSSCCADPKEKIQDCSSCGILR